MDSNNYILLVFEGEKTEKKIIDNLKQFYLNETNIVLTAYCGNIYNLYHTIQKATDLDEYLDLLTLLKEKDSGNIEIQNISIVNVAEIYLFFDYDGHDTAATDEKLLEMLSVFNEETENGKLYISYPMVEALKHVGERVDYQNLFVEAKNNIKYKTIVSKENDDKYNHIGQYTKEDWEYIIYLNCLKLALLMEREEILFETLSQDEIFNTQLERYIIPRNQVGVLSAFPIFLVDYYGYKYFFEK